MHGVRVAVGFGNAEPAKNRNRPGLHHRGERVRDPAGIRFTRSIFTMSGLVDIAAFSRISTRRVSLFPALSGGTLTFPVPADTLLRKQPLGTVPSRMTKAAAASQWIGQKYRSLQTGGGPLIGERGRDPAPSSRIVELVIHCFRKRVLGLPRLQQSEVLFADTRRMDHFYCPVVELIGRPWRTLLTVGERELRTLRHRALVPGMRCERIISLTNE